MTEQTKRFIECCCTSAVEAAEAAAGGASRVELCEELQVGGVTPRERNLRETLKKCSLPVNVLIRPRGGDFVYNEAEKEAVLQSIRLCKSLSVNGVVIGGLTPEGDIDIPLMRELIAAAKPLSTTFHRAFDECRDPFKALEEIIALGFDRILTSGQAPNAPEGADLLAQLVRKAAGRIVIMPGAGVRPSNIAKLESVTGASEFHSSAHGPSGATDRLTVRLLVESR